MYRSIINYLPAPYWRSGTSFGFQSGCSIVGASPHMIIYFSFIYLHLSSSFIKILIVQHDTHTHTHTHTHIVTELYGLQDLSSPTRDWTCAPVEWKRGVSTTGLPGKSPKQNFKSIWHLSCLPGSIRDYQIDSAIRIYNPKKKKISWDEIHLTLETTYRKTFLLKTKKERKKEKNPPYILGLPIPLLYCFQTEDHAAGNSVPTQQGLKTICAWSPE